MLNNTVEIKGLDISDAMSRLRNNAALYTRLMGRFIGGAELAALKDSMASGDVKEAAVAAHTMKGAAANLSAVVIRTLAAQLEQELKSSGSIAENHFAQLGEIEKAYSELKAACEPYLDS